ncbi:MAG: cytochrome c biogenesis protein CcsA [Rubrivivax sp.]|nr:cytochrome c biogenesis protein CcsA [Rubrivivax sp.]
MSLSPGFSGTAVPAALSAGVAVWAWVALIGYAVAAAAPSALLHIGGPALLAGLGAHVLMLAFDIGHVGLSGTAARLGFGPVLSLTVCAVVAVHAIESRLVPVPKVRRALALAGLAAVALAMLFPGDLRLLGSPWAPLHWLLGVAAYGLFGAAVLHALLLDESERRLRSRRGAALSASSPGMPLLQLERITYRFVQAGFVVLTAAIVLGMATSASWRLDHKTVLSLGSWALFAALLAGRHWRGWRGRQATRWLYAGALVLLLAYAGTRFVSEVLLGR